MRSPISSVNSPAAVCAARSTATGLSIGMSPGWDRGGDGRSTSPRCISAGHRTSSCQCSPAST
jgi:transcription elongation factor